MVPGSDVLSILFTFWVFLNELFENESTVVLIIMCSIHESNGSFLALLFQHLDKIVVLSKFLFVTLRELLPFCRVMTKPFPEIAARHYSSHPEIKVCFRFRYPPRP